MNYLGSHIREITEDSKVEIPDNLVKRVNKLVSEGQVMVVSAVIEHGKREKKYFMLDVLTQSLYDENQAEIAEKPNSDEVMIVGSPIPFKLDEQNRYQIPPEFRKYFSGQFAFIISMEEWFTISPEKLPPNARKQTYFN